MIADAIAFFQAFDGMEAGFRERADDVMALLRSPIDALRPGRSPRRDTVDRGLVLRRQAAPNGLSVAGVDRQPAAPVRHRDGAAEERGRAAPRRNDAVAALWGNLAELRRWPRASEARSAAPGAVGGEPPFARVPLLATTSTTLDGLRDRRHDLPDP